MLKILLCDMGTCRRSNSNCKLRHAFRPLHGSKRKEKERGSYRPRSLPPVRPAGCVMQLYLLDSRSDSADICVRSLVTTALNSAKLGEKAINHSSLLLHHLQLLGLVSLYQIGLKIKLTPQGNDTADHSGRTVFGT
jgi:hypothetical protein